MKPFKIFSLSIVLLLFGCGQTGPKVIEVDSGFSEYVSGYSSGVVGRTDDIKIELAEPISDEIKYTEKMKDALVSIDPSVKGHVVFDSDREVRFVPDEPFKAGQFYTVSFKLDALSKVEKGYELFQFQFSTPEQRVDVELDGLYNYSSFDIRYQRLEGSISTTDFADSLKLTKTMSLTLDGKEIPFRFTHSYGTTWYFEADSIERTNQARKIVALWDGTSIRSMSKGRKELKVSALGDFTVDEVDLSEQEDQIIELHFSEPIDANQDLKGIIDIPGIKNLSFSVDHNKVRVYLPNRFIGEYEIKVSSGIRNTAGAKMNKPYNYAFKLHPPYPAVKLLGSGSILPNSQGLIFPFKAVALKAVDVRVVKIMEKNVHHFLQVNDLDGDDELTRFGKIVAERKVRLDKGNKKDLKKWNTHVINLEDLISAEPGAIYQVAIRFNKSYTICDCSPEKEEDLNRTSNEGWNERDWHTYGFGGYSTWGYYDSNESPCNNSYYYGRAVRRNILASDIGMVFKLDAEKKGHAILSDMVTAEPMVNTTVEYYDYTNQLITKGVTDAKGMFTTKLKKKPFLMIAKKGRQRGYLKLRDGQTNSLSKFDVSGDRKHRDINGFIYAERGVWRPGDSIFVNFILQDTKNSLPNNHPVKFKMKDPNGNVVHEVTRNTHVGGVYDFRTATSASGATGYYYAEVVVGDNIFNKSFRVETVKPNRLKIYLDAELANASDSCGLRAEWLHGASANGLEASVDLELMPMQTSFKKYKSYVFDSPIRNGGYSHQTIFEGSLNEEGEVRFANRVKDIDRAAGKLRAHYTTKVFEKSGNFSIDRKTATYSPYDAYVGLKVPSGSRYDNSLVTNQNHEFKLVSLSDEGKLKKGQKLNLKIFKVSWNWWYDGTEDLAAFTARQGTILAKDTNFVNTAGQASFQFKVPKQEYGKYLFVITDESGGHQTGKLVYFDWPYWSRANRTESSDAAMMTFATNKKKFVKGETVKLTFPSPSKGKALISIENSEHVLKKTWIDTQAGETNYEFVATAEMTPNVFIHVTLLQPHHATQNDLPIRMYGVMPIEVDDPATHLSPIITMRDEIRPESKATIKVHEQKGKSMTYTLAVVDDGLLDLTHFGTPQPWNTFYASEALGVRTWDMYDDVIGAFSGKLDNLLSVGGGGGDIVGNGPKANRFKPMVRFIGPFKLPAGASKTHQIDIPNYVGSVRVMVVARNEEAYGNAQKTVTVKKPLMVLATMPRVLGPGEEFDLPVNVFAMEDHVKNVSVRIESNGLFEQPTESKGQLTFKKPGDQLINFKLKTKQEMGIAKVKVIASAGNEIATHEIEIDVRPSNPYSYEVKEIELAPGESANAQFVFDGLKGSQSGVIEVSTLPAINLQKRLDYLIHYPHGCVEQTTSAVFPQLYLSTLSEIGVKKKAEVVRNVKSGILRLQRFQTYDGGFAYWPGESTPNDWGTNYAGHFLLEAEGMGYKLPSRMKERWVEYQQNEAQQWSNAILGNAYLKRSNQLTQAYRLYLLAVSGNAEIGAMNRLKEVDDLTTVAKWRLAGAYAQIGQHETAHDLVKSADNSVSVYRELSNTFGSSLRDKAIIFETQTLLKKDKESFESMKYLAQVLGSERWLSTQETAYALLSISKYAKQKRKVAVSTLACQIEGVLAKSYSVGKRIKSINISPSKEQLTAKFRNNGSAHLFVTVITRKIPKQGKEKNKSSKLRMKVTYKDMNGQLIDPTKVKQGTEFLAVVQITNPTKRDYNEMALNQIFPSGWEVHNSRMYGGSRGISVRYQDYRDDRVLSYYSIDAGETKTIKVMLNATFKGKFYLPAVYSEAMYDHSIHAQAAGKWVSVI